MTLTFAVVRREEYMHEDRKLCALWLRFLGNGSQEPIKVYVSEADYAECQLGHKFEVK